ncbi:MAG: flagellar hook assembly protein FlgD, partial [Succinivibrionaceae bacterium]|nr:flagellar hook assembly protein FlgD [Succinivibrionaceae bacterium]
MSIYSEIGLSTTEATSATAAASGRNTGTYDLSQADFLSLLTTELAYQ